MWKFQEYFGVEKVEVIHGEQKVGQTETEGDDFYKSIDVDSWKALQDRRKKKVSKGSSLKVNKKADNEDESKLR